MLAASLPADCGAARNSPNLMPYLFDAFYGELPDEFVFFKVP
jgi:hypothetical protein